MFLLSVLLAAAPLAFTPVMPDGVPNVSTWEVTQEGTLERDVVSDLFRSASDGGAALEFIQKRGICPAEEGGGCTYAVRYEMRRTVLAGHEFVVHRYVAVGLLTGVRVEGLLVSPIAEVPRHLYYRRGISWKQERGKEDSIASAFVAMLYEQTRNR